MNDRSFKPAGAAIAALVAGLAHAALVQASQVAAPNPQPAKEADARKALAEAAQQFGAVTPFARRLAKAGAARDIPLGNTPREQQASGQLDLPFRS
jgi:hypothetical protein